MSCAKCPGLSPAISAQFSVEMCTASKYCEKFTKNPFWEGSRSFKVIDVDNFEKPVISACYDKQDVPICNRVHATRDNCAKITTF